MQWTYQNKPVDEDSISDYVGFVYEITNLKTNRKYLGKKLLKFTRTKKVAGKTRRKKTVIESDWKTYWGSNKQLLADIKQYGEENFECWIYVQCKTKKQLTYWEMHYQCKEEVLIGKDRSYNDNILGKFFTKDLL